MLNLCYRFISILLLSVLLLPAQALEPVAQIPEANDAPDTLIAVAAEQNIPSSEIHTQISQAPYFLFFSHEGTFLNSQAIPEAAKGSLAQVANFLVKQQVTVMLSGHFDEDDLNALTAHDIIPIERQGAAADIVTALLQCEPTPSIPEAEAPNQSAAPAAQQ